MAKSARFDHSFLVAQVDKRKGWNKKGVKAGHGGNFDIEQPLKALNTVSGVSMPAASMAPPSLSNKLIDTASLPKWLVDVMRTDAEVARAVAQKKVRLDSPHKTRLAQGIKNPTELNDTKLAEHWLQVRLFYTIERHRADVYPYMFSVPNGGARGKRTASMMKYEGQKSGISDIIVAMPRGKYHGLYLEVKTEKGRPTPEQKDKQLLFSEQGYCCLIERGYEQCIEMLHQYCDLPHFDGISCITER